VARSRYTPFTTGLRPAVPLPVPGRMYPPIAAPGTSMIVPPRITDPGNPFRLTPHYSYKMINRARA